MRLVCLAEYGADEFLLALLACAAAACALRLLNPWLALLPLFPFAVVVWFFRDPERRAPDDPELLVAPADGTVTDIEEVDEPAFIGGKALRIGIFLSPFNVHVNRAPCAGVVRYLDYKAGEFLPAYNPAAPQRNEARVPGTGNRRRLAPAGQTDQRRAGAPHRLPGAAWRCAWLRAALWHD